MRKTSAVLNSVLTQIYHLKKGSAVKYSKKNDNINPFESGGETPLEFFSRKTDCSIFVVVHKMQSDGKSKREGLKTELPSTGLGTLVLENMRGEKKRRGLARQMLWYNLHCWN
ncbi:hypothetical protein PIB30_012768 [Stylosanthes scabra]|uniref:Brix domain-containing protein n=1 Tax=Stylosanthes scabra TaxID=79078 RepID=A0ABU6S6E6_9FABA|nr:hypothetical protein [Stylosanthes scabra]